MKGWVGLSERGGKEREIVLQRFCGRVWGQNWWEEVGLSSLFCLFVMKGYREYYDLLLLFNRVEG